MAFLFYLFRFLCSNTAFFAKIIPMDSLLGGLSLSVKGGDAMYVTYSDLIQIGLLIVAIVALFRDR